MTAASSLVQLSRQDTAVILAVTRALAAPFDLPALLVEVTAAACRGQDFQTPLFLPHGTPNTSPAELESVSGGN